MSENCNGQCAQCGVDCDSRQEESLLAPANKLSNIRKVIGVVSGKGGVGKTLVTSLLAVMMQRNGHTTAILDADVTGPSVPRAFGLKEKAGMTEHGLYPVKSKTGIPIMSTNLLLQNDTDPVVWRGPVISGVITQFWSDTVWGDVDYMFVDLPPGTGDVPLTVFQSLPLDGIVIVTTPQELVSMIVEKAVNMAKLMNVPILGVVENMSYYACPDCGKKAYLFGEGHVEETAARYGIAHTDSLPIDPDLPRLCDQGVIELVEDGYLGEMIRQLEAMDKEDAE